MRMLLASLLFATACSSSPAFADQVGAASVPGPRTALAIAPAKIRAPYDVQVMRENGETAPTYAFKDRFYVQGNANERYTIRVTNPTANRVEAVVTVDGLDVIDGDTGDLHKRGYIIPPYGETRVEGFRTSLENVATFRFSSVDGSYAGQKGKARNVGVIAVAIFEENAPPAEQQIVVPNAAPVPDNRPYDWTDDLDSSRAAPTGGAGAAATGGYANTKQGARDAGKPSPSVASADKAPAPPPPAVAHSTASAPRAMPSKKKSNYESDDDGDVGGADEAQAQPTHRPGLGTEFGEQRYSGATYTRFVRAADRPIAVAELRYNDGAGLTALGIPVEPLPDDGEIMTRETADPFPGSHFSQPPR